MSDRVGLGALLKTIDGVSKVYFQSPGSNKLEYPCILYAKQRLEKVNANNALYQSKTRYSITLIDKDPDTVIPDAILKLPLCSFDRVYVSDNLYHYIFNIYY